MRGRGTHGRGADKQQRKRKGWSEEERAAHAEANRRKKEAKEAKAAEKAREKEKEYKKKKKAFANLLLGRRGADDGDEDDADSASHNEVDLAESPAGNDKDDGGDDDDDEQQKMPADNSVDGDSGARGGDDGVGDEEHDAIMQILDHPPIVADMEDGDDEYDLTEDADDSGGDPSGVSEPNAADVAPTGTSAEYLEAIYKRFQYEFTGKCKGLEAAWLMELLKRSNFVVPREEAKYVCTKLKLRYSEPYYYQDVVVWVPDEQWGVECTPCCPSCGKNDKVGVHGYRTNHFGRRIVSLSSHYFIMSRRYICYGCKEERGKAEAAIAATAEREGINIEVIPSTKPYTFMGYNPKSVSLLPFGHGDSFPAFFTHRSGVDKKIIDLMRPLFNAGVRPEQLSNILLELHSKEYTRQWKHREHQIEKDLLLNNSSPLKGTMFSAFADKSKYNGAVPTGKYLGNTYKLFHESIRSHLDKEVKKRGATRLHWDVSYKEAKHLCQYKGKQVYKGLVTATNEYGEIRVQFHIVTDSHEQMSAAIAAFRQTTEAYGQPPVKLFSTDNPSADKAFFQGKPLYIYYFVLGASQH